MADKDPGVASAEAAATQLVKSFYPDLFQPAAREVGAELHEFVRAVMVAGRGFGYLIRETYEPFVRRALSKVPKERQIAPQSSLLGKILEGVSYEREGSHVDRLSNTLLATAMDRDKSDNAHPAFVDVIHKISEQELQLLESMSKSYVTVHASPSGNSFLRVSGFEHYVKMDGLIDNADVAFDNLRGAGLINFVREGSVQRSFRDLEQLAGVVLSLQSGRQEDGRFIVKLSPFGRAFLAACSQSP